MSATGIKAPEKFNTGHDVSKFQCGEPALDDWLRRQALQNQQAGASSTYVVSVDTGVIGYYSLAAGSVQRSEALGRIKRNMPEPVPIVVLGRLAVHQAFQNKGIGRALLRDAIMRTVQAADIIGVRAIVVHALSERAKKFYENSGFEPSPMNSLTLMISISDALKNLKLL